MTQRPCIVPWKHTPKKSASCTLASDHKKSTPKNSCYLRLCIGPLKQRPEDSRKQHRCNHTETHTRIFATPASLRHATKIPAQKNVIGASLHRAAITYPTTFVMTASLHPRAERHARKFLVAPKGITHNHTLQNPIRMSYPKYRSQEHIQSHIQSQRHKSRPKALAQISQVPSESLS